jgi:uncharacterized protein (DUF1778 family)
MEDLSISKKNGQLVVEANFAVKFDKLTLGSVVTSLSNEDWGRLYKQIKKSLEGGRMWPPHYRFDKQETWAIKILPLKTKRFLIRFDPLEFDMVRDAAKLAQKNIAEFIRAAVSEAVSTEFDKETLRKQEEREQEKLKQSEKKPQRYVT